MRVVEKRAWMQARSSYWVQNLIPNFSLSKASDFQKFHGESPTLSLPLAFVIVFTTSRSHFWRASDLDNGGRVESRCFISVGYIWTASPPFFHRTPSFLRLRRRRYSIRSRYVVIDMYNIPQIKHPNSPNHVTPTELNFVCCKIHNWISCGSPSSHFKVWNPPLEVHVT